jgi:hypothetical protein
MDNENLMAIINRAVDEFHGDSSQLESAIGALILGQYVGWKVLMLIHSRSTLKNYSDHLSVPDIRKLMPPTGAFSHRSLAWRVVEGTKNFWKVVRGEMGGIKSTQLER